MTKWINLYATKGQVQKEPISMTLDKDFTQDLRGFLASESDRLGRTISKASVFTTLVKQDKGFREFTANQNKEAHANSRPKTN